MGAAPPALMPIAPPPTPRQLLHRVLALSAPTTALSLLQVFVQLAETILASRQGTAALAGWAVLLPFNMLMQQMSTGAMGGGVVSAVAQALGGGRRDDAASLVTHALIIATSFGLLFAIGVPLVAPVLVGAVAGADSVPQSVGYAWAVFGVGALASWWSNTLASVLRGGGQHGVVARVLSAASLATPPLAWALAEGAGLGLAGIGLAFALLSWASAWVMAVLVRAGRAGFMPRWALRPSWALFERILRVGAVASFLALLGNLASMLVTAQLRHYGPAMVAAYGVAARLEFLVVPVSFGVGSALTALVGRAVGQGDWPLARRTAWMGGGLSFIVTGVLGLAVALWPLTFAGWFTGDAQVAILAASALRYTGLAFGGFGLGMAMYFASLGAARMAAPLAGGFARLGVAVGGGWLLADVAGLGADGNFIAVGLALVSYGVINAAGVRAGVWRAREKPA